MKSTPPETPERIILAGDMALRAGIAIGSTTRGLLGSTVIDVSKKRKNVSLARALKFMAIQIRLFALQHAKAIDLVAYEEPAMHARSANKLPQYAMVSSLLWASDDLCCSNIVRHWPSSVKKRATGSGKATKADMIDAAKRWSGYDITDDNEADAMMLLKVVFEDLQEPEPVQEILF